MPVRVAHSCVVALLCNGGRKHMLGAIGTGSMGA